MEGTWSSGMILASGARGREFDSPSAPVFPSFVLLPLHDVRKSGIRFYYLWQNFIGNAVLELESCGWWGGGALGTPIQFELGELHVWGMPN